MGKPKLDVPFSIVCWPGVKHLRSNKHDLPMAFPIWGVGGVLHALVTTRLVPDFLLGGMFNFRRGSFQGLSKSLGFP
jgi:hypothetical protein